VNNRAEVSGSEFFPINVMPGFTCRVKIANANPPFWTVDPMTERKDWWGIHESTGSFDTTEPYLIIVRDTVVSNNFLVRYQDLTLTGIFDDDTGFTPAADTFYVITLMMLSQAPGSYLLRIGTTVDWRSTDTIIHQTTIQGDGDFKDRDGINAAFNAGCKTLDTVAKRNFCTWFEGFATQDYDPSLGGGD